MVWGQVGRGHLCLRKKKLLKVLLHKKTNPEICLDPVLCAKITLHNITYAVVLTVVESLRKIHVEPNSVLLCTSTSLWDLQKGI